MRFIRFADIYALEAVGIVETERMRMAPSGYKQYGDAAIMGPAPKLSQVADEIITPLVKTDKAVVLY